MYLPKGLTVLVGPAAAGKTTFCKRFAPADVVSSDRIRGHLTGDERDHSRESQVFARLHQYVQMRLRARLPIVIDATNLDPRSRRTLLDMAARFNAPATAVRFRLDADTLKARNASRARVVPSDVLDRHIDRDAALTDDTLYGEGFDLVVDHTDIRGFLWGDFSSVRGIDVIGDVHGQLDALDRLLAVLGYAGKFGDDGFHHPDGRLPVFVGDLVDKGPESIGVLHTVMNAFRKGQCLSVRGNHEHRLGKALGAAAKSATSSDEWRCALLSEADQVKPARRLTFETLADHTDGLDTGFGAEREFLASLPLWLRFGDLIVVHAAFDAELAQDVSPKLRRVQEAWFMYGPGKSKGDARRVEWINSYSGTDVVAHGHFTVDTPELVRNANGGGVISLDTGAGDKEDGRLSALRWGPEMEIISVDTALATQPA